MGTDDRPMNKRPFRQAVEYYRNILTAPRYTALPLSTLIHMKRGLRLAEYLYQRAKEGPIKRCPFCGNVPGTRTVYRTKGQSEHIHQVVCWTCTGDSDSQVQLPVHKWNQRER